jgi:rfaE bifunctional protein kinase chain/domain
MVNFGDLRRHKVKRVLVIGDVIADIYRECFFKKMCPDAPTVKAVVESVTEVRPGGAANVAVNLASLSPNTQISLIGTVDVRLARSIKQTSRNRVDMSHCTFADDAFSKERVLLDGEMLVRIDSGLRFNQHDAENVEYGLKEYLAECNPDLVVMSDYGAGSINETSLKILLDMRERLLVDTKMTDLSIFGSEGRLTRLVKLNYDEWKTVVATEAAPERFFLSMVMTSGQGGANLSIRKDEGIRSVTHTLRVEGHKVEAVDVCGCGDTFLAGLATSLLANEDDFSAVQFANAAAATVVTEPRTAVANRGLTLKLLGRDEE